MKISNILKLPVLVPLLVFLALAVIPLLASFVGQPFYVSFAARLIIYAIAVTALNIAVGYGGMISLGHALFLGLGSYCVALASFHGISNGWVHLGLTVVVCSAAALLTGAISLRTSGVAFIMITLAFAQMGYYLLVSLKQYGGDDGLAITETSRMMGLDLGNSLTLYMVAFVVLVLMTAWAAKLKSSPFGMVLRGTEQNARRIKALGFDAFRYQLIGYVVSGTLCGVAGMLLANLTAFASPSTMSWAISGELLVMLAIGGLATIGGPVLGVVVFLGLEEITKGFTEHWMAVFGPAIVAIALLGKSGLAGLLLKWEQGRSNMTNRNESSAIDEEAPA